VSTFKSYDNFSIIQLEVNAIHNVEQKERIQITSHRDAILKFLEICLRFGVHASKSLVILIVGVIYFSVDVGV